jgi:hypothetical protein
MAGNLAKDALLSSLSQGLHIWPEYPFENVWVFVDDKKVTSSV